jgi:hypothetical protein
MSDILGRRPDLRACPEGVGHPTGGTAGNDRPRLQCDQCGATWGGRPYEACGWCADRPELDRQIQASIDQARLRDYLWDVAEGSQDAIVACSRLLKVAIPRGTLPHAALRQLRDAISEAA